MHYSRAKTLGIVGAILLLLLPFATIPQFGGTIILHALAVILVALWYLAYGAGVRKIFTHYRTFFILMAVVTVASLIRTQYWDDLNLPQLPQQALSGIDVLLIILPVIAAFFLMQSYRRVAEAIHVRLFSIVGIANFALVTLVALSGIYLMVNPQPQQAFRIIIGSVWVLVVVVIPILTLISFAFLPTRTKR